ncbi:MAG: TolB family protein [Gemmatimonadales bacterium]
MRVWIAVASAVVLSEAAAAQGPPGTDIHLVPITLAGRALTIGPPRRLTNRPGYDNQPSFTPDGKALLYTVVREGGPGGTTQADIFRLELATGRSAPVVSTPESEYSATPMPGGREFAVIRVERDSTQRLWAFPLAGGTPRLLLPDLAPVGYQAWLDANTVGLYVLGSPATLQVADLGAGGARILLSRIGRAVQRIPGRRALSVTQQVSDSTWWIVEVDPTTAAAKPIVAMPPGAEYYVWLPDGSLLSAEGSSLYRFRPGSDAAWVEAARLPGLSGLSRLAVSPRGDAIAIVAAEGGR